MTRFIVRFRGSAPSHDIVTRLCASPTINVLEETARMVLVEGSDEELRTIVGNSQDVVIVPERSYQRPNPALKIERK